MTKLGGKKNPEKRKGKKSAGPPETLSQGMVKQRYCLGTRGT